MEIEDNIKEQLENKFIDSFGMTIDQFERLDYDVQEELIKKVAKINSKLKRKEKSQFILKELFAYYPIFKKTNDKRKRLFKK